MDVDEWEMGRKTNSAILYNKSREYEFAERIIGKDYKGGVHCDGYEAYRQLTNATMLGCWASARRKFVTALEVNLLFKQLKELSKVEQQELVKKNPSYRNILNVLEKIKYLFQFEEEYTKKNYEPEEIRK